MKATPSWRTNGLLALMVMIAVAGQRVGQPQAQVTPTSTYYIAPDGRANGIGTKDNPFPTAATALAKVGGGHTLIFRPGIYRGPIEVPLRCKGTAQRPTILKSEEKWKAVVVGAAYHVITNADGCDWLIVDGFEVMGARYDGIKMNGDFNTVRNCYVHNNSQMGIAMHNKTGGAIEDNLIEFNGSHMQFHHGVYASGDKLTVRNNIVRHNASFGLHLYPSLTNSTLANNLVYGHAHKPGIIVACPPGGGRNLIVNNTIAFNAGGLQIWHGEGEIVVNNIIAKSGQALLFEENTKNVTVDYNLLEPKPEDVGAHNITGDPNFVEPEKGVFWLRPDSPAIGRGDPQRAPAIDFWGRSQANDKAIDLGCFPFVPALAAPQMRRQWDDNWAYRFAPASKRDIPDLWALPS